MSGRDLDPIAVAAVLRRLARGASPPALHIDVARRLGERLEPIRLRPERLLDWWAGPGASEAVLRERLPEARQVAVEPDRAWFERRQRATARPWWRFGPAPVEARLESDDDAAIGRAQLVWSNMALHGVLDPPAQFARWHRLLEPDGVVIFSCLGPGSLRGLREVYAANGWPAPVPGFVDMHDLGDMLVSAGFAHPVLDQETLTVTWPDADALLRELRQLGGNAAPGRFAGLRTPDWRRRLVEALAARAGPDGRLQLGFEVAYGHAFKGGARPIAGAPVSVPLEDMRAMVRRGAKS